MLKGCQVGDYIKFGTYEQDNNEENGTEEIEWLVLDIQDGKALVISKHSLFYWRYYRTMTYVTWERSDVRERLNSVFSESAFNTAESMMILTTTVSADANPNYNTSPGAETQDKVFLLSIVEANKYFHSDSERICTPTEYAKKWIEDNHTYGYYHFWWLRSSGKWQDDATYVNTSGSINTEGNNMGYPAAVRPAMWIDLNA